MASSALVPSYTLDDLEQFPDDGNRYELLDGFLLVTPSPLMPHDVVTMRLTEWLMAYLRPGNHGVVFTRGAVQIAPNTHLEPDVLVIPPLDRVPERWLAITEFWLAVEVSGTGSRVYDRDFKGPAYLRLATSVYWRVDLRDQCVYVSQRDGDTERPEYTELRWCAPGMDTPLVIDVPALFAGIDERER